MGQIDLFEHDNKDTGKALSEILELPDDDRSISEILELPDDNRSLSEILEIPDLTEGDFKADNDSDVSEFDCKLETKDKVRLECDQDCCETQSFEIDLAKVASEAPVNLVDSVTAHRDSDGSSLAQHSVNALDEGFLQVQMVEKSVEVDHIKENTKAKPNKNAVEKSISKEMAQSPDAVLSVDQVSSGLDPVKTKSAHETMSEAKTDETDGIDKHRETLLTSKHGSASELTVKEPNLESRCLSPNVDISIPPRPKSNSLASRKSKETTKVSVVSEKSEILEGAKHADTNNVSVGDITSPKPGMKAQKQSGSVDASKASVSASLSQALPQNENEISKSKTEPVLKQSKNSAKKIHSASIGAFDEKNNQSMPKYGQVSKHKQTDTLRTKDKSPSRRVYRHGIDKAPSSQHEAVVSVQDETVHTAKGKASRPGKKASITKALRTKPTYV